MFGSWTCAWQSTGDLEGGDLTSITMAVVLWTDCVNFGKPWSLWSWFLSFQTKEGWVWWFLRLLPDLTSLVWFSGVWSRNAACDSDIPTPLVLSLAPSRWPVCTQIFLLVRHCVECFTHLRALKTLRTLMLSLLYSWGWRSFPRLWI